MKWARALNPKTGKIIRGEVIDEKLIAAGDQELSLSKLDLLSPVEPSKIICVGLNYKNHIE